MHSDPTLAAEFAARDLGISECRTAIRNLQLRLESLEHRSTNDERQTQGELQMTKNALLAVTRQLFSGEVTIEHVSDPEIHGEEYFVFRAAASGTLDQIVAKYDEWHRQLPRLAPGNESMFRLSIDARA